MGTEGTADPLCVHGPLGFLYPKGFKGYDALDAPEGHLPSSGNVTFRLQEKMPPKSTSIEVEFKLRINRELMEQVNSYRHDQQLESKKEAIVQLLTFGLSAVKKNLESAQKSGDKASGGV